MAVNNSIVSKKQAQTGVTEYESSGEIVKLSPTIIKKYLVTGGGAVTDEEVMMFLSLCRFQHLNPFTREAYLIKYGTNNPATMVVGKGVFLKRARQNPQFNGMQAGVIVVNTEGIIQEREGTFYIPGAETLLGGWARVYIKGYDIPFYESVALEEYIGRKKDGSPNSQWATMPATMIRKVAQAHALREAFPVETSGMYAPEEIKAATDIVLDEAPVMQDEKPLEIPEKPLPAPAVIGNMETPEKAPQSVEDALFGGMNA